MHTYNEVEYKNPNTHEDFDGSPYIAAGLAVEQVKGFIALAQKALTDSTIQVRNSHLQRTLDTEGAPDIDAWDASSELKLIKILQGALVVMNRKLGALQTAASFDPTAPLPKEEK